MKWVKKAGYKLFAFNYGLGCAFSKIKENHIFLVETNDASKTGNIGAVRTYLGKTGDYKFTCFSASDRDKVEGGNFSALCNMFFVLPIKMAGCRTVFMDNGFLPLAYCHIRKGTNIIQLWHGTGSLKRFGQDVNTGDLAEAEKAIGTKIDIVAVNAECQREQYARAFGVDPSKIAVTGLPRTDALVNVAKLPPAEIKKRQVEAKGKVSNDIAINLTNKYAILYAPTFRDSEVENPELHMDIGKLMGKLPADAVMLVRLHPFVYKAYKDSGIFNERVINVSDYKDLNELLIASDALITDYSSIFFDFCVFKRPMYFFADDLIEFSESGRGFYMDYAEVPGEIFTDENKLADSIIRDTTGDEPQEIKEKRNSFITKYYAYFDGASAARVVKSTRCLVP